MSAPANFTIGRWAVTPALNLLVSGDRSIKIEPRAMDVLARLAERPGEVVSVDDLFTSVWRGVIVSDNSVYVAIKQLRQALDAPGDTSCIETIPKRGYRLTASVERPGFASPSSTADGRAVRLPAEAVIGGRSRTPWLIAGGLAIALCAAVASSFLRAPVPPARAHWQVAVEDYVPGGLTISADGRHIAYLAETGGVRRIWLRPVADASGTHSLPGTEAVSKVFWSPDSRSLAFTTRDNGLMKIDVAGGSAEVLGDGLQVASGPGAWSSDGAIWVTTMGAETFPIATLTPPSRRLLPMTVPDPAAGESGHFVPRLLPDGDHFLYVGAGPGLRAATVYVGSRAEPSTKIRLLSIANTVKSRRYWNLAYVDGLLLYVDDTTLVAQRFDAEALTLRGEALVVREDVDEFAVSSTGMLVYTEYSVQRGAYAPTQRRLAWFNRRGERLGEIDVPPAEYTAVTLSPNGSRVAATILPTKPGFWDVSIIDTESGVRSLLTFDDASDEAPIWSPDGSQVVFSSARGGLQFLPNALYRRTADGTGGDELLFSGGRTELVLPFDWSREGADLVFGRSESWGKDADVWVLPVSQGGAPFPLLASPAREGLARLSPDGRFIAYVTNVTGRDEVVVQPFPDVDRGRWKVSSNGGSYPRWRGDGRELFYVDPGGVLMATDVETDGEALVLREQRALFSTGIDSGKYAGDSYDVTADGERFLLAEAVSSGDDPAEHAASKPFADIPIHVIVNWAAGLNFE